MDKMEEKLEEVLKNQRTIMRQLVVLRSNASNEPAQIGNKEEQYFVVPSNSVAEFQELEEKIKQNDKAEKYFLCTNYTTPNS